MVRPLASLVVAFALLLHGVAWPSAAAAGAGAHACCLRLKAQGCAGTTISCCPAPERGRETTPAPTSTTTGVSSQQTQHSPAGDALQPAEARALAFDAHARVRANAPPGPLYLKHLTLLV